MFQNVDVAQAFWAVGVGTVPAQGASLCMEGSDEAHDAGCKQKDFSSLIYFYAFTIV